MIIERKHILEFTKKEKVNESLTSFTKNSIKKDEYL
jgi:hypothetical protein